AVRWDAPARGEDTLASSPRIEAGMSQQFLSKYFKRPGESKKDAAGGAKKPSSAASTASPGSKLKASPKVRAAPSGSRGRGTTKTAVAPTQGKKRTASPIRPNAPRLKWQCPQCTFDNPASKRACDMCGKRRAVGDVAPEEIEICSSGSETGAANKLSDGGDSNDSDSDFEGSSISPSRKRTLEEVLDKDKARPATERQKRKLSSVTPGVSAQPTRSSGTGSLHGTRERSPLDGARKMRTVDGGSGSEVDCHGSDDASGGYGASSESCSFPLFGGRATPTTGASSAAVFSADSFDLNENETRRSSFQAGLKAALRDDDNPSTAAGIEDGGDRGGSGPDGEAGTATDQTSKSTSSSSRGKGKGKSTAAKVKLTPMEQQVVDLKEKHPGVLLLVECGYRYRFFGEDALAAAKVLRIYAHMDHNFQVASVPTFRLAVHLRRLVDAGYKVGVVRQAESAALKAAGLTETGKKSGTFKRELAAVFSQATWVEGAVEALLPASISNSSGAGAGAGGANTGGAGKSGGQGSFRKIGGTWRRIGGWGGKGKKGSDVGTGEDEGGATEGNGQPGEPATEASMDAPLPQVDHERAEQWLMCIYEEDSSPGAVSEGEPLSISIALNSSSGDAPEREVEKVRVGLIAVDVRTGKVVYDAFEEGSGQRQKLHTRLTHLRPLELLLPGPRLSKATESALTRYCESAVDIRGDRRVVRTERLPPEEFCFEAAQASLSKYYGEGPGLKSTGRVSTDDGDGSGKDGVPVLTRVLDLTRAAVCALGPLVSHLERFGLDRSLASPDLTSFSKSQYMTLDAVTLRDLEVLQCQADGREAGSLFSILDHTQTAFGRRVLAGWVRQPLLSPEDINARQEAVEELATDPPPVMERLRPTLRDLKDLDPAIASLHHRRIQPSRLLSLLKTMHKVSAVFHPATGEKDVAGSPRQGGTRSTVLLDALAGVPANTAPLIARYLQTLEAEAAASDDYVHALVDGESLCMKLGEARRKEEAASEGLEKELRSVRNTIRKPSLEWKTLRTGATSTVEYLVELRKSEAKKLVPSSWMQVSQTKDLVRFHTPEVLRLQQELLRARESRNLAARQAWAELVSKVDDECYAGFRTAVHALGTLDALLSLSAVAKLPGYVRPKYYPTGLMAGQGKAAGVENGDGNEGDGGVDEIVLRGARHPTVERVLEGGFVPNDVNLRRGECLVVTGPNMGGKSSTVRMVALLCIMGQMGSYVPADSADMYALDTVCTRMGAGDDLAAGMSTFMVELWHTSYIIKHATRRSLVVLDELGRGTSTHDGVAIALATLRHMVRDIGCATLFVTHYPQVADLAAEKSLSGLVKNAHMSFIEDPIAVPAEETTERENASSDGESRSSGDGPKPHRKVESHGVTFLYRLVVGQAHRSYGLNVARAAGMDEKLIELAARKSVEMRDKGEQLLSLQ
ncbi:unnamed protein product, partial [Scytosiphon promiscuus]